LLRKALIRAGKTSYTAGTLCVIGLNIFCKVIDKGKKLKYNSIGGIIMKKIFFAIIILSLFSCRTTVWTKKQTNAIFGESLHLKKYLYDYNSQRSLLGDGYSLTVFELPNNYSEYINENFNLIEKNYPTNSNFRCEWNIEPWKTTPINNYGDAAYINQFVISQFHDEKNREYKIYKKYIETALNEEGNYYCYFYSESRGNIDFYVYVPKEKILIMINHNT
jgi:hypothetical protein